MVFLTRALGVVLLLIWDPPSPLSRIHTVFLSRRETSRNKHTKINTANLAPPGDGSAGEGWSRQSKTGIRQLVGCSVCSTCARLYFLSDLSPWHLTREHGRSWLQHVTAAIDNRHAWTRLHTIVIAHVMCVVAMWCGSSEAGAMLAMLAALLSSAMWKKCWQAIWWCNRLRALCSE